MKGLIFDIKRFAVHDGPGIRTTLFLKGCPLSCWWCHNPESRSSQPESSVRHLALNGTLFEQQEVTGREVTVQEVLQEVSLDRVFYDLSGGGVTLSGGEPLYQEDFCAAMLRELKSHGYHTALDTTGYASGEFLRRIIPYTDLFLYDLKLMDDAEHQKYTGISNRLILENLQYLLETGQQLIIRVPVIPGITDTEHNIREMIGFLRAIQEPPSSGESFVWPHDNNGDVRTSADPLTIHLLPYHATARNKYQRFKREQRIQASLKNDPVRTGEIRAELTAHGFRVQVGG